MSGRGETVATKVHLMTEGHTLGVDSLRFYRIASPQEMRPFLVSVVGASNLWLFITSNGGVSAGRRDADSAIFPYYTEDKIADNADHTGGLSQFRVRLEDGTVAFWQPFAAIRPGDPATTRSLYKDFLGTTLVFEEARQDLGLCLRVAWQTSARYGIVRTCRLISTADRRVDLELLDGVQNLLPPGATAQVQNELSILLDAYKRAELEGETGLGLFYLNSALTDLAEASESLSASVAWHVGLGQVTHLLSGGQVDAFGNGRQLTTERDIRGERGAYLVHTQMILGPGEQRTWRTVADTGLSAADVVALRSQLADPEAIDVLLDADIRRTRETLDTLIAGADATQLTGDELASGHHAANVLFNSMRGGVPASGYSIRAADVRAFMSQRSPRTAIRNASLLAGLPDELTTIELVAIAERHGDPDLWRLANEYLPLTFGRRHGDPSRPWNKFRIEPNGPDGRPQVSFQGNWRDIFQNWEALTWSFPEFIESMIVVFLNATTADGYNPYRISSEGIEWEIPEPENPWANIGYWSDHQIAYLVKLLETAEKFHPGRLRSLVDRAVFTHADVPYRIATYASMLENPRATISFDHRADRAVARRVETEGADGKLLHGLDDRLVRITLGEKLVILLLAKVVNLVPDVGIWMNTQRPEWNDANNALVGRGASVVTLAYLRRFLAVVRPLLTSDLGVTKEVGGFYGAVREVLGRHLAGAAAGFDDAERRQVVDQLGAAGTSYRDGVYAGHRGETVQLMAAEIGEFLDLVTAYVDSGLQANRRDDGLYHAYNVLTFAPDHLGATRLQVMLEGQVAILSSGLLTHQESVDLLHALRTSSLYCAPQHSYLLYPDKTLPRFLDKNLVSPERAATCPLIDVLVRAGDRSLILRDLNGDYRFAPGIHNARDIETALSRLSGSAVDSEVVDRDRLALLEIFEDTFHHAEFTGRSGSFFAYEGLGSIYWHMVSKLLLATQEALERAEAEGADQILVDQLADSYEDIRRGLGYCKTSEAYGAFPCDPYSHTPSGRGARQPGMTGQVKEDILARWGELGLRIERGRIGFRPFLLREEEWTVAPTTFRYVDVHGATRELDLPAGSLAFTFCQVPVVFRRGQHPRTTVELIDNTRIEHNSGFLDPAMSAQVFQRSGAVRSIEVTLPRSASTDSNHRRS